MSNVVQLFHVTIALILSISVALDYQLTGKLEPLPNKAWDDFGSHIDVAANGVEALVRVQDRYIMLYKKIGNNWGYRQLIGPPRIAHQNSEFGLFNYPNRRFSKFSSGIDGNVMGIIMGKKVLLYIRENDGVNFPTEPSKVIEFEESLDMIHVAEDKFAVLVKNKVQVVRSSSNWEQKETVIDLNSNALVVGRRAHFTSSSEVAFLFEESGVNFIHFYEYGSGGWSESFVQDGVFKLFSHSTSMLLFCEEDRCSAVKKSEGKWKFEDNSTVRTTSKVTDLQVNSNGSGFITKESGTIVFYEIDAGNLEITQSKRLTIGEKETITGLTMHADNIAFGIRKVNDDLEENRVFSMKTSDDFNNPTLLELLVSKDTLSIGKLFGKYLNLQNNILIPSANLLQEDPLRKYELTCTEANLKGVIEFDTSITINNVNKLDTWDQYLAVRVAGGGGLLYAAPTSPRKDWTLLQLLDLGIVDFHFLGNELFFGQMVGNNGKVVTCRIDDDNNCRDFDSFPQYNENGTAPLVAPFSFGVNEFILANSCFSGYFACVQIRERDSKEESFDSTGYSWVLDLPGTSKDTILFVNLYNDTVVANGESTVWIVQEDALGWTTTKIISYDNVPYLRVSIHEDKLAVAGLHEEDKTAFVHVYQKENSTWSDNPVTEVEIPDVNFVAAVAIGSQTLAVGVQDHAYNGLAAGLIYTYSTTDCHINTPDCDPKTDPDCPKPDCDPKTDSDCPKPDCDPKTDSDCPKPDCDPKTDSDCPKPDDNTTFIVVGVTAGVLSVGLLSYLYIRSKASTNISLDNQAISVETKNP